MSERQSNTILIVLTVLGLMQAGQTAYSYSMDSRLGRIEGILMERRVGGL